jgi:hypothetical protein
MRHVDLRLQPGKENKPKGNRSRFNCKRASIPLASRFQTAELHRSFQAGLCIAPRPLTRGKKKKWIAGHLKAKSLAIVNLCGKISACEGQ